MDCAEKYGPFSPRSLPCHDTYMVVPTGSVELGVALYIMVAKAVICFALFASTISTTFAANDTAPRRCGTTISRNESNTIEASFQASLTEQSQITATDSEGKTINVYWHVISEGDDIGSGNIPDSQINDQIDALNQGFSGANITFVLANTTRTINSDWFRNAGLFDNGTVTPQDHEMKQALRQGGAGDLNVYSVNFTNTEDLLGYAPFPAWYSSDPVGDGVVILFSCLPGGSAPGFSEGKSLVHEVGHWTGLYHTFENGCDEPGDRVSDTPPEASFASGCPTGRNTCHESPDLPDPIHNYMDYTLDECLTEFTEGQYKRLLEQISVYRGI
ncbi:Metalloprotease [Fomitiporia mediterranea MF3/22]|uniref:Metalloprotease n=1 Tax=Fomitiporia mediterranea (strain MF3/22) TaxID=694068 RepID=UPI0004409455|nr:Metalloprotease [Fomitiporia mediterranea MF3/22]EJD02508.1 Metalloprotease [Fomitiporia mediterranea MF3/22]